MPAAEFTAGQEVWAHTGTEASFERGKVERLDPHKKIIAVRLKAGVVDVKEADVHKVNAAAQDGVPDNTYLRELNEATLLHNVRTRYNDPKDDGGCYSVTGHILIAVNPFRKLNIYEESNVRTRLCARTPADGSPCAPALAALALPAPPLPGRPPCHHGRCGRGDRGGARAVQPHRGGGMGGRMRAHARLPTAARAYASGRALPPRLAAAQFFLAPAACSLAHAPAANAARRRSIGRRRAREWRQS